MQLILKRAQLLTAALSAAWLVAPTQAHHSFAMFDQQKSLVLKGTVKEFQWTNPHSWLQVDVPNDTGGEDEWSIELNSISGLHQAGWRPKTFAPGDKVTVTVHPLRDGTKGASLVNVVLPNGSVLGSGQGGPRSPEQRSDAADGSKPTAQ